MNDDRKLIIVMDESSPLTKEQISEAIRRGTNAHEFVAAQLSTGKTAIDFESYARETMDKVRPKTVSSTAKLKLAAMLGFANSASLINTGPFGFRIPKAPRGKYLTCDVCGNPCKTGRCHKCETKAREQ